MCVFLEHNAKMLKYLFRCLSLITYEYEVNISRVCNHAHLIRIYLLSCAPPTNEPK